MKMSCKNVFFKLFRTGGIYSYWHCFKNNLRKIKLKEQLEIFKPENKKMAAFILFFFEGSIIQLIK
jgi:hypothetical protein